MGEHVQLGVPASSDIFPNVIPVHLDEAIPTLGPTQGPSLPPASPGYRWVTTPEGTTQVSLDSQGTPSPFGFLEEEIFPGVPNIYFLIGAMGVVALLAAAGSRRR